MIRERVKSLSVSFTLANDSVEIRHYVVAANVLPAELKAWLSSGAKAPFPTACICLSPVFAELIVELWNNNAQNIEEHEPVNLRTIEPKGRA
jgi:hypothetical protein